MTIMAKRVLAAVLGLTAAFVGSWALFAPHSFYTSFPLPGHHWVAALPPYNEHLTRDVGAFYLALFAISLWAVCRPAAETFRLLGVAWLVFSVPHLTFHAAHLSPMATSDQVGNMVALGATVLFAAPLLVQRAATERDG
jgi:hypothetical protein